MNGSCNTHGGDHYIILLGKPEGKRAFWKYRRRWENNIKINLKEIRYEDMKLIELAQDSVR
jgi:hypothetical protein